MHYEAGKGRHKKDGVRLAVGETGWTTFVALTGPNPEVRRVSPILLQGLTEKWDKTRLAGEMAGTLRAGLRGATAAPLLRTAGLLVLGAGLALVLGAAWEGLVAGRLVGHG